MPPFLKHPWLTHMKYYTLLHKFFGFTCPEASSILLYHKLFHLKPDSWRNHWVISCKISLQNNLQITTTHPFSSSWEFSIQNLMQESSSLEILRKIVCSSCLSMVLIVNLLLFGKSWQTTKCLSIQQHLITII